MVAQVRFHFVCILCVLIMNEFEYGCGVESESLIGDQSGGFWRRGTEEECSKHYLCLNSNNSTYVPPGIPASQYFNTSSFCTLMHRRGVKNMFFIGDSFMR